MSLKTTTQIAIENAIQNPKGKNLRLLGRPSIIQNDSPLFSELFEPSHKFFYLAEKISQDNTVVLRERGIGRLLIADEGYEIERVQPLGYYIVGDSNPYPCVNGPIDFAETITISSSYPFSLLESLSDDHSVVTCSSPFVPQPVQLSNFSLLGRLDGDIISISFDELCESAEFREALVSAITGYSKQMVFSASKINTKTKRGIISSSVFQLVPTSNPPAKKGTLIYDEADDKFKYYNGEKWRTLVYEENE